jgi:hypothetical protein
VRGGSSEIEEPARLRQCGHADWQDKMKRLNIIGSAAFGLAVGCLCMAVFLFYIDRPRSVPSLGYVIDILGAGVAAAAVFSLVAWLNNLAAGSADKPPAP